jgi:hypothetical protein
MKSEPEKPDAPAAEQAKTGEPPALYLPSCGVLCDVFWWTRRKPASAPAAKDSR